MGSAGRDHAQERDMRDKGEVERVVWPFSQGKLKGSRRHLCH